jgi:S1-C subfamily serine protease
VIDLVLALIVVGYAVSGYRQGLAVGTLSLGGFVVGAVAAMLVVPPLADRLEPGLQRSFAVLVAVLLFAWLGQLAGALLGAKLRDNLTVRPAQVVDQLLGGLAGVLAVGLVLWFIGGALRGSPSTVVARTVASSQVLSAVDRLMPQQVSALAGGFRDAVADTNFPRVFAGLGREEIQAVEPPNGTAVSRGIINRAKLSTVKITGQAEACGRGQEGSGAVVGPQRVVTNAHVVAGMQQPRVQVGGLGDQLPAEVVLFDAERDLAVLRVPGLDAAPLRFGQDLGRGEAAVVAGFPRNGAYKVEAARVRSVLTAVGEDIYGRPGARRQVYSLFTLVQPGNSGGPVIGVDGSLVGIVFAKSLDDPDTGYALTMQESLPFIQQGLLAQAPVNTGPCAAG